MISNRPLSDADAAPVCLYRGPLLGADFPPHVTRQPPPEICADPRVRCTACAAGIVLPAVPGAEKGLCFECWFAARVAGAV